MKILETQSAALSNYEVLTHLEEARKRPRSSGQHYSNVDTILKEVTDYLNPKGNTDRPTPVPPYLQAGYDRSTIKALLERLKPFSLTKSEALVILNLRPVDLGLLDCIVEECDERFSTEEQQEMLAIIGEVLGGQEPDGDVEGAAETNGATATTNGATRSGH